MNLKFLAAVDTFMLIVLLATTEHSAKADWIIGVPFGYPAGTAPFVKIDPASGSYSVASNLGNSFQALAQNSHGEIFAAGRITRIDPATGTPLQQFSSINAADIRALAFDGNNRLFAVLNRDDAQGSPTINDDLLEINLTNQTTQVIGSLGFLGVQALDFSPNGELYAWDVNFGLLTVNPLNGAATDVNPSIGGTAGIQSIVFSPDGRLFGARQALYSINPVTGAFLPVGPASTFDIRGIEWIVPEPASGCLLAMTVTGLLCRQTDRHKRGKTPKN
jgi:hypothetical protein